MIQDLDPVVENRFWDKTKLLENGCIEWTGALDGHGYGSFRFNGKSDNAYSVAWKMLRGPRVKGFDLDHTCHGPDCPGGVDCEHRRCVNPAHLEPVTREKNLKRSPNTQTSINMAKTHCIHGHEFTPENTYLSKEGWRSGRTCKHLAKVRRQRVKKMASAA